MFIRCESVEVNSVQLRKGNNLTENFNIKHWEAETAPERYEYANAIYATASCSGAVLIPTVKVSLVVQNKSEGIVSYINGVRTVIIEKALNK